MRCVGGTMAGVRTGDHDRVLQLTYCHGPGCHGLQARAEAPAELARACSHLPVQLFSLIQPFGSTGHVFFTRRLAEGKPEATGEARLAPTE